MAAIVLNVNPSNFVQKQSRVKQGLIHLPVTQIYCTAQSAATQNSQIFYSKYYILIVFT
jgi:hypothetical protein